MLWYEKKGIRKEREHFNEAIADGVKLEETAINVALDVIDPSHCFQYYKPGIIVDPWTKTCCSPDLIMGIWHQMGQGPTIVGVEVKVPHSRGIPEFVCDVPTEYIIQCFASIHITKAEFWYLFFYNKYERKRGSDALFIIYPNQNIWDLIQMEVDMFLEALDSDQVPETKSKYRGRDFCNSIRKQIIIKKVIY